MPDSSERFEELMALMQRLKVAPNATGSELRDCSRFGHAIVTVYHRPWQRWFRRTAVDRCVLCDDYRFSEMDLEASLRSIERGIKGA